MNIELTDTESLENVKKAFGCESQARNRYTYFSRQAMLEGDEKTAELFAEMADNEREHAKVWYKVLNSGIGSTLENLEDSAGKEQEEWKHMYPVFAQKAREEGLELLAIMFENIGEIEKNHQMLFEERIRQIKSDAKKGRDKPLNPGYVCQNCGFVMDKKQGVCPVCEETGTFAENV